MKCLNSLLPALLTWALWGPGLLTCSLFGQSYLAQYEAVPATPPAAAAVSDMFLTPESAERYVFGTTLFEATGRTVPTLWHMDTEGNLGHTQVLVDPLGIYDLEGITFAPGIDKQLWLGSRLRDGARVHGVVTRLDQEGEVGSAIVWPETEIVGIDFAAQDGLVVVLGSRDASLGESDFRVAFLDGEGQVLNGFSLESLFEDGAVGGFQFPGGEGYTLIGWQKQGDACAPVWVTLDPGEGQLASYSFTADRAILSVADVAVMESQGIVGITGKALADNGLDTMAYLMTLDREGQPIEVHYYRSLQGGQTNGMTLTAAEDGFVLGGAYLDSLNQQGRSAWAMYVKSDGTPQWNHVYEPGGSDATLDSYWAGIAYDDRRDMVVASGPAYYTEHGVLNRFQARQMSVSIQRGVPEQPGSSCYRGVEGHVQTGSVTLDEGGYFTELADLPEAFELETAFTNWVSGYCATPTGERGGTTHILGTDRPITTQTWTWYDMQGRSLWSNSHMSNDPVVPPSHLPKGYYVLHRVESGQVVGVERAAQVWP